MIYESSLDPVTETLCNSVNLCWAILRDKSPGEIHRTSTATKPHIQTKFPRKQILPIALFKPSKYISPHLLSFPARAILLLANSSSFFFSPSSTPAKQINHPSRWRFGAKPAWQINLPANVLLILSKESRVHSAHPSQSEWLHTYCWKPWTTVLIVNREGRTRGKKKERLGLISHKRELRAGRNEINVDAF